MAVTDINTKKITGCEKNTLTYYHEEGHLKYNASEKGMKNGFWMQSCLILCVIYLVAHALWPIIYWAIVAAISCGIFLWFYLYEEYWCWKYAYNKQKKKKPKDI